jgi:hypothetical protein
MDKHGPVKLGLILLFFYVDGIPELLQLLAVGFVVVFQGLLDSSKGL